MRSRRQLALAGVAALAVAGCGGAAKDHSTLPTATRAAADLAAPATGTALRGTGYTLRLARGWNEITGDPALEGIDYEVAAADTSQNNTLDVSRNKIPAGRNVTLTDIADGEAKLTKATSAAKPEAILLDGTQALRTSFRFVSGGIPAESHFVIAIRDGYGYQVRLLANRATIGDSVAAYDAMVSSWHWTS
jgi:hypothetical protein